MKEKDRRLSYRGLVLAALLLVSSAVQAQISGTTDNDVSAKSGSDSECATAKNPINPNQVFAFCNTTGTGMLAARSTDGGASWFYPDPSDKTIVDGDPGQGPNACCDPTLAWDTFGNLYITYLGAGASVETILSTDGGGTFTNLVTFTGSVDQPTVVAANTTQPGAPVAVWIVWNQSGSMVARGAPVTGLCAVGAFGALQTAPSTGSCSFGDIAIGPTGVVVQVCTPSSGQTGGDIRVNVDPDGLGGAGFGPSVIAGTTNVGGFDFIPAQPTRSVDPETGLVFDANPASPHFGRLYLMYTDEVVQEQNDLDIMVKFSDDNGNTWPDPPIRVNDDATTRSQFNPKISIDDAVGNFMVCWHDCRESPTNTAMREYCTAAGTAGPSPTFLPNVPIGDGLSTTNNDGFDFGDYSGLDYSNAAGHPIWGDTSNSTGTNPNGTGNFDAQTDVVTGAVPVRLIEIRIE
jgi:hypothetical protein